MRPRFAGSVRRPRLIHSLWCVALSTAFLASAAPGQAFDSGRLSFSVKINDDLIIPYRTFAVFVLPGETLRISAHGAQATAERGELHGSAVAGEWRWSAPASQGVAPLHFTIGGETMQINALVMYPAEQASSGTLAGYRIGHYPEPLGGNPVYTAPDGFFELAGLDGDVWLSPHFRLSQFPSKQSESYPKFLVLSEDLLLKLEMLLERVNEFGIEAPTFTVMSGYRTPMYNRAIDNVSHSRHIYGAAADIYVDESPRDGVMDDLNGDGTLDHRDAQVLYRIAEELFSHKLHKKLRGGLGVYRSTAAHGPFIHIDARGMRARWGLIP